MSQVDRILVDVAAADAERRKERDHARERLAIRERARLEERERYVPLTSPDGVLRVPPLDPGSAYARPARRFEAGRALDLVGDPLRLVAEADHAFVLEAGGPGLARHDVLFARGGWCVATGWARDRPRVLEVGKPVRTTRVLSEALAALGGEGLSGRTPAETGVKDPAPAPILLSEADLRSPPPGGAAWATLLSAPRSLRVTKTDLLDGRGTASMTFLHTEQGAWRARLLGTASEGGGAPLVEIAEAAKAAVGPELRAWIVGRGPWSAGPFTASEAERIRRAQEEASRRASALWERRTALFARFGEPLIRRRIEADHEAASGAILEARARALEAIEPDPEAFRARWSVTPEPLRLAPPAAERAPERRYVEEAEALLPDPGTRRRTESYAGVGVSRNYAYGPRLRYEGPRSIDAVARLGVPAVIVARSLTPGDLEKIEQHLSRVRGFVVESGDVSREAQIFLARAGRAAVIDIPGIFARLEGADEVFVDGVEGLVVVGLDDETARRYETLRLRGRPSRPADDVALVVARVANAPDAADAAAEAPDHPHTHTDQAS